MDKLVYLNGEYIPESRACVSVFDRGFLFGDGAFETMRSYAGRIFRLERHIGRLWQSARILELHLPIDQRELGQICKGVLERNNLADAIVRISVTRGRLAGGIGTANAGDPTIVAFARPGTPLPAEAYTEGVSARIVSIRRCPSSSLDPQVKSMNFLNLILARAEAERSAAYEAIMLNQAGTIAEASTGNVFFVNAAGLITPSLDCDILPGITREAVIEIARKIGIAVEERHIDPLEIEEFTECFLTNSGVELLPVSKVEAAPIGKGSPGPIYKELHTAYRELVHGG